MQIKEIENIRANFNFYITLLYTNGKKYTLNIKNYTYNLKNINKKVKIIFQFWKTSVQLLLLLNFHFELV